MSNLSPFPIASRPIEYVGLLKLHMSTKEGPTFIYIAVDAYSEFAIHLGMEKDNSPEHVIKYIYLLTENEKFKKHMHKGFTLVLESYEELSTRINSIIYPVKGKLMFNKSFNNFIVLPVLKSLQDGLVKKK